MPVLSHNEFYGAFVFQAYQLDPNCEYTRLQAGLHCGYRAPYYSHPQTLVLPFQSAFHQDCPHRQYPVYQLLQQGESDLLYWVITDLSSPI